MKEPYDLDADEMAAADKEAREFAREIELGAIPAGHGTYREKRPGLGITTIRINVCCAQEPHKASITYQRHAWRTVGEDRFGDSIRKAIQHTP